jgi:nucleoside-diphosphate-sugar epimerase
MNNKIAIIGSNSFAAQYIIKALKNDYTVTGYSRTDNNSKEKISHVIFDYPKVNLDYSQLLSFDHIIYTAGAGIQSNKADSISDIYELNSFLPIRLFNFLNQNNFQGKFITFGSYSEIGQEFNQIAYDELGIITTPQKIHNDYGNSKRILTRFFSNVNSPMNYFHLILPTIYGFGENPKRLIPYVVRCLRNGEPVQLTNGHQIRQYLHCKDLSLLIETILSNHLPTGIYNVICKEEISVREVVNKIINTLQIEPNLEYGTAKRADESLPNLIMNTNKLKNLNVWNPSTSIEDSIADYM